MIFSSILFLCYFLPTFYLVYCLSPKRHKNAVLLVFSLLFYTFGGIVSLPILLISIAVNHLFSVFIERYKKQSFVFMSAGVCFNVLLLTYCKYFEFLLHIFGVESLFINKLAIPLPVGVSFFTFQGISYLVDVFRGEVRRSPSLFDTALYISMFPQLIAGPIVRYSTVAKQISERSLSGENVYYGVQFFIAGLGQKVLIANTMAGAADNIFSLPFSQLSTPVAWVGAFAYSLQILFDFAGYSNMAIGLGLMMGFTFPPNFNYPYISASITEFWRRWHMSLSSWLKDYVYIPLGGNRLSQWRTYSNLFIVFFICGIWHGANWTFLIWGIYHGLMLLLERLSLLRVLEAIPTFLRRVYTVLIFVIGWVIFRSESLDACLGYLTAMFYPVKSDIPILYYIDNSVIVMSCIGIFFSTPLWKKVFLTRTDAVNPEDPSTYNVLYKTKRLEIIAQLLLCVVFAVSLLKVGAGSYSPFIYFRF